MLIGLNGQMRSGKDTAAQFILDWAETRFRIARRDAFADRLKISAGRALGWPLSDSGKSEIDMCNILKTDGHIQIKSGRWSWSISGREFLQLYGTESHRQVFGTDFWIDAVLDQYRPNDEILVVADVRFPNEAEAIRAAGGEVWEIIRGSGQAGDGHASEQPLPAKVIDRTLFNDTTLDEFRTNVLAQMNQLVTT